MQLTFYFPPDSSIPFDGDRNRGRDAVPPPRELLERYADRVRRIDPPRRYARGTLIPNLGVLSLSAVPDDILEIREIG